MLRLRVKEIAVQQNLSMNKLSQKSQVSYNIVRDVFNHPFRTINTDTLNRLAAALEVPVTDLIEDVPKEIAEKEMKEKE